MSSTQTNTRLCGSVQISEYLDEYLLNCFYCSETFLLERWFEFIDHLKALHYEKEIAFKLIKYPNDNHDNTTAKSQDTLPDSKIEPKLELFESQLPTYDKLSLFLPSPLVATEETKLLDISLLDPNCKSVQTKKCNPLSIKHNNYSKQTKTIKKTTNKSSLFTSIKISKEPNVVKQSTPPHTTCFKKYEAETSSNVKSSVGSSIEEDSSESLMLTHNSGEETSIKIEIVKHIPARPHSELRFSDESDIDTTYLPLKDDDDESNSEIAHNPLMEDDSNTDSGTTYNPPMEDKNNTDDDFDTKKQTSRKTVVKQGIKKLETETNENLSAAPEFNPKELVFEFTPPEVIMDLLDKIKNYPVLWEFHNEPNNIDYAAAINVLRARFREKWSLNLNSLQMRFSINRILMYYRYMIPCDKVELFKEYFEKCLEFLPLSEEDIPRNRCVYCDVCCETDSGMRKHLVTQHKSLKWTHKCEQCSERFRQTDEYELHKKLPHFKEIFRCKICNFKFKLRHCLKRHLLLHEPKVSTTITNKFKCKLCSREFETNKKLQNHEYRHKKLEKRFKCHICSKLYNRNSVLALHMKRHLNQLDFVCEVCGKGFYKKSNLDDHMGTHSDTKITCRICNLQLKKCSLPRHLRLVHVAYEGTIESTYREKGYQYKRFIESTEKSIVLNKTRQPIVRNKPSFDCKKCEIPFERLKFLKDHNKEFHTDVKTFNCKICDIEIKYKPSLKRHYHDKHKLQRGQIFLLLNKDKDLDEVLNADNLTGPFSDDNEMHSN